MITNERQYRITKAEADRFAAVIEHSDEENAGAHPLLRDAMKASLESQLYDLRQELADYEALRTGEVDVMELDSLNQLPEMLIRARIATRLTQKQLAERLGIKEQQIQRYEATRYAAANLERIQAVAEALGVRIQERVLLPH